MGSVLDLHLHTSKYSACSRLSPKDAVKRALRMNIDDIVITEHDTFWEPDEVADLLEQTGAWDFNLLVGQELRGYREDETPHADILAFGFYEKVKDPHPVEELVEMVHEANGVARRLVDMDYDGRVAHPCIGPERADMVIAGTAIFEAICRRWPVGQLRVADRGLREGILLGLMRRTRAAPHARD